MHVAKSFSYRQIKKKTRCLCIQHIAYTIAESFSMAYNVIICSQRGLVIILLLCNMIFFLKHYVYAFKNKTLCNMIFAISH